MSFSKVIPSIQSLKKTAKQLASTKAIHLNQALDLVANEYGFTHWALMIKYFNSVRIDNTESIWKTFLPGEMVLLSASKDVGKLSMALNLAAHAIQKKISVKYFSMHVEETFISERLSKIVESNLVNHWISKQYLVVKKENFTSQTIVDEITNNQSNSLLIIDYLQAIKFSSGIRTYHDFLKKIKLITQKYATRVLILSQINEETNSDSLDYIDGGRSVGRHFSHIIHIEKQKIENKEQRDIVLLKSIHYQKQKSLLQFNQNNYRFI